jgi:hypothetical protein
LIEALAHLLGEALIEEVRKIQMSAPRSAFNDTDDAPAPHEDPDLIEVTVEVPAETVDGVGSVDDTIEGVGDF